MSLNSKRNHKYNRAAADKSPIVKCYAGTYHEEADYCFMCHDDWLFEDYHDRGPTMREVRIGQLLQFLTKLRLKSAKELFDTWYW